jgi:flagellar M-ring protein FliF
MDNASHHRIAHRPGTAATPPAATGFVHALAELPARMQLDGGGAWWRWWPFVALMFGSARDADYRVLFPNLSEKDGGQVIEKLTQLNVPYRFTVAAAIMVPAGRCTNCA